MNDLGVRYQPSEVQLDVGGNTYSAADLLDGLGESDKNRPVAIETGTGGCFIRDAESDQRLFQVVWSPNREGWHVPNRDIKTHYFPLDISREEISARIDALIPRRDEL